ALEDYWGRQRALGLALALWPARSAGSAHGPVRVAAPRPTRFPTLSTEKRYSCTSLQLPFRARGCEIGTPYVLAQRAHSMHRRSVVSTYKAMPRFVKESRLPSSGPSQPTFASAASIC